MFIRFLLHFSDFPIFYFLYNTSVFFAKLTTSPDVESYKSSIIVPNICNIKNNNKSSKKLHNQYSQIQKENRFISIHDLPI